MNDKELQIIGSGGKSGAKAPKEAPNTLQSRSTIRLVEVISEGEIKGVVGGLKGVYFDDTPVQNLDNTYNFPAVLYDDRKGTNPQTYLPGFPSVESPFSVNVELTTVGIVRTNTGSGIDAVRVIVKLPNGLTMMDTKTGDLNGYRVGIAIDTRPVGGTYSQVFEKTITGKTTTQYEEAYRIDKPAGVTGNWEVRVRRTTTPAGTSNIQDTIFWDTRVELVDIKVDYTDAAVIGIAVDSETTGGTVPRRSYLTDGIICKVPINYTPTVYNTDGAVQSWGSYSGVWNGTFKYSWTDDPAWILYDLLTNTRYGLGDFVDPSTIDIYSFYDAAIYNNELVQNMVGFFTSTEPRFRWNGVIQTREDAYKVLQSIAGTMRAVIFSGPGSLKLIQDRPTAVSAMINNANVIDGRFTYSGTELTSRITSVDVTYNDQYDRFLPRTINEQATSGQVSAYGFNKIELGSVGIVSEGQARRLAKWALDSSLNSAEMVQFTVSWNNAFVEIGDVVNIADASYSGNPFVSGLIVGGSTTSVTFDRPITVPAGTKLLRYMRFDGTEVVRAMTGSAGTFTTLTLASGEDMNNLKGAPWYYSTSITQRPFKITSVAEEKPGFYTLSGTFYDASKYARVESGIITDPPVYSGIGGFSVPTPGAVTVTPETYVDQFNVVSNRIRFTWVAVTDPLLKEYKIRYRKDNQQYEWSPSLLQNQFVLDNAQPGVYEFSVYAYNNRGVQSPPSSGYYTFVPVTGSSGLSAPATLDLVGGGTSFNTDNFTFQWASVVSNTNSTLKDYRIQFLNNSNLLKNEVFVDPRAVGVANTFNVKNTDIKAWYGTFTRNIRVRIQARDTLGRYSTSITVDFTNPAPAVLTSISTLPFFTLYQVNHAASVATDFAGVLIHHSTTTGFTPSGANLVADDTGTSHLIEAAAGTTYYTRIAAYDTWGQDELNYSGEVSTTTSASNIGLIPTAPTGLTVTSAVTFQPTGSQSARITIQWNNVAGFDSYDLEILEFNGGTATGAYFPTVAGTGSGTQSYFYDNGIPGRSYRVRVRARSASAVSAWSAQVSHTALGDTVAPGAVSGVTVTAGYRLNVLRWTNPADSDLRGTQIHTSTTLAGTYTLLTTVSAPLNTYVHTGLAIGQTVFYRFYSIDDSGNLSSLLGGFSGTTVNVGTNTISANEIVANTITAAQIAAGTITAAQIQAASITGDRLVANTITAGQIAAGTITAVQIAAGTITGTQISAGSINADRLVAGSITATQLATTTLITTSAQIANAVIQTANIANATITSAKFAGTIASDNYVAGVSGWQIRRDNGAAEFGDLTARGDFNAGATGTGRRMLITTSDPTYLIWSGTGALNDANATFYIKKDGSAYFGGTLIAGTINTSAQSNNPSTPPQSVVVGPYVALANPNTRIYATFQYDAAVSISPSTVANCNAQVFTDTFNMTLERSFDAATWTTIGIATDTQNTSVFRDIGPPTRCDVTQNFAKTYTVTDVDATPGTRYYRYSWSSGSVYHLVSQRSKQLLAIQVVQGA